MILESSIAEVVEQQVLLDEHFVNNQHKWEIADNISEMARIEQGTYLMLNKTTDHWMYYQTASGLRTKDDFIISATIECMKAPEGGTYGLLWGFERNPNVLNRFVISASHPRFGIIHFERPKAYSFVRNYGSSNSIQAGVDAINEISIVKIGQQLYFFINDAECPVFQCNQNAYPCLGTRVGFYTEPGQLIRAHCIQVRKLITKPALKSNWKELLQV